MKLFIFPLILVFASLFSGCASNEGASAASEEEGSSMGASSQPDAKTAYEGSTGSGLLMERYKAGSIEGLND